MWKSEKAEWDILLQDNVAVSITFNNSHKYENTNANLQRIISWQRWNENKFRL